ncbi:MAG: A/G-specific adenine glycosylase [Rhodobacterales bacterium]|nr:MAG: A/G-specific adenine glycosylase [Rhodobacterales bacterium]
MSDDLLDWYDRHARDLPWRMAPGGQRADPYRVWLSEVMLQQTTVAAVKGYFERFTTRWPTVEDLAAAEDDDVMAEWAGLGYYARARNLLKCARAVAGIGFPEDAEALRALPGIGPYTAAAVSAIAFQKRAVVVDGNVERVMARLHDIHTPLPAAKPELTTLAEALTPQARPGDYAQAVMDLGATICTPKSPACGICPWRDPCLARARGTAAELPKKTRKPPKPTRDGVVWVARRADGALLLERRPPRGLLGGTLAFPTSGWDGEAPPPLDTDWHETGQEVRHTFTHFHLILEVLVANCSADAVPDRGAFRHVVPDELPSLMRKVALLGEGFALPQAPSQGIFTNKKPGA